MNKYAIKEQRKQETMKQVKQALRQPYAWPGGYPLQMATYDGCICHKCVRKNFRAVAVDTRAGYGGWAIQSVDILWEGEHACVECGAEIETAYGN